MADEKPKSVQKKIRVTPTLWGLLDQIASTQLFGDGPAGAASAILKREVTRMVTSGELKELLAQAKTHECALDKVDDE